MREVKSNIWKCYLLQSLQGFWFILPIFILYFKIFNLSYTQISSLEAVSSIVFFIITIPCGAFSDLISRNLSILIGTIMVGVSMIIFGVGNSYFIFLSAGFIWAIGDGFLNNARGALMYDSVKQIGQEHEYLKIIPFVLIGNKSDLIQSHGRKVKLNSAKKFAKDKNSHYIETSAKTGLNVEKAFRELTRIIAEKEGGVDINLKKVRTEAFFIKSKLRKYIKSEGYKTSNDLLDGNVLNDIIIKILDKAISTAKEDGRKTVLPKDIRCF